MKIFFILLLITTKLFASELSFESMKEIKCYYYDDPNENPTLMLYFTNNNEKLELIVNQAENTFDEAPITTIFQNEVNISETNNKIIVKAEGLLLEIKTPVAFWNHGEARNSKLILSEFGLNTNLICEQQ